MSDDDGKIVPLDPARAREFEAQFESGDVSPRDEIRAIQPGAVFMGMLPGQWRGDAFGRPPHDPVIPLGYDGDLYYFLTARGTVSSFNDNKAIGKTKIKGLYSGFTQYLWWAYPAKKLEDVIDPKTHRALKDEFGEKKKEWVYKANFEAEQVTDILMNACAERGAWKQVDQVRGRGAWCDEAGRLILHLGDEIRIGDEVIAPGEHDGLIYPNRPKLSKPADTAQPVPVDGVRDGFCGHEMHQIMRQWNWVRPELDAMLMLGWLCAAPLGGALDYRPTVFVTGDKAVGKSTIQELAGRFFGAGMVQTADTTAAGIYQHVGHDSLPVLVDELEAEADSRKVMNVVKLARLAATGAAMLRGGSDNNPIDFKAQSCFLFSSINIPPLSNADRSRMAMLELNKIDDEARGKPPDLTDVGLYGRELLRRMTDCWGDGRLQRALAYWRELLISECDYDGRGAATFGTLMAFAWVALHDDLPDAKAGAHWASIMEAERMNELVGNEDNWRLCIDHLFTAAPDVLRNVSRASVGAILEEVRGMCGVVGATSELNWSLATANSHLHKLGCAVKLKRGEAFKWSNLELYVAAAHPQLNRLFEGTPWQGVPGAGGVWATALRQMPASSWRQGVQRAGGPPRFGILIRLADVWSEGDEE